MKNNLVLSLMFVMSLSACNSTMDSVTDSLKNAKDRVMNNKSTKTIEPMSDLTIHPALAAQDPLLAAYGTSAILLFTAQEIWLDAMGDAEGAAQLKAERTALENGAVIDSDAIERHKKISERTSGLIKKAADKEVTLNDEGRKKFLTGWVPYIAGLVLTDKVVDRVEQYSKDVADEWTIANSVDKGRKSLVLATLLKSSPSYLKTHYNTGKLIIDYSNDQGLEVPKEANNVMKDIEL